MADCVIWEADYSNNLQMESLRKLWGEYADATDGFRCMNKFKDELQYFPDDGCSLPNGATFVLANKDRIVGAICVCPLRENYAYIGMEKYCVIKRLYVQKKNRENGLGNRLIQKCINRAIKLKYDRIRIELLPSMETAKRLFTKKGFVKSKALEDTADSANDSNENKLYFEMNLRSKSNSKSALNIRSIITLFAVMFLAFFIRQIIAFFVH